MPMVPCSAPPEGAVNGGQFGAASSVHAETVTFLFRVQGRVLSTGTADAQLRATARPAAPVLVAYNKDDQLRATARPAAPVLVAYNKDKCARPYRMYQFL